MEPLLLLLLHPRLSRHFAGSPPSGVDEEDRTCTISQSERSRKVRNSRFELDRIERNCCCFLLRPLRQVAFPRELRCRWYSWICSKSKTSRIMEPSTMFGRSKTFLRHGVTQEISIRWYRFHPLRSCDERYCSLLFVCCAPVRKKWPLTNS